MEKTKNNNKDIQKEEQLKKIKRQKQLNFALIILAHIIGSALLILLGMIWQKSWDLMAWTNSLWLAFAIVFFIAWIMIIYNANIISSFVHSIKTFGLMFVGRRPKKKYYEVKLEVEENQIPKRYVIITFSFSLLILIPAIITLILELQKAS